MKNQIHDDIHMALIKVSETGGSAADASFLSWVLGAVASTLEIGKVLNRIKNGSASKEDVNLIRSAI